MSPPHAQLDGSREPPEAASTAPADGRGPVGWGGFLGHVRNYLLGGVAGGLVAVGSVAILTRLLTPSEYGVLKVWMAVLVVLGVVFELNFRGAVSRYYLEERDDFADFLKTALLFLLGLSALNLTLSWALRGPVGTFFRLPPGLFFAAAAVAVTQVPWNLNWKLMVSRMESGPYARLRVGRDLLVLVAGGLWVYSLPTTPTDVDGGRELGQIYGLLAVNLAFGVALGFKLWRIAAPGRPRRVHLRYALAFGVPLIPHALSGHILSAFDRVIINQLDGETSAGLYSFAYDVGEVMAVIVHAMNSAWLPLFTRARNREQHEVIDAMANAYAQYVAAIAIALVLFAREVAAVLADARYAEALPLIPVIVLSYVALFLYTIYANHSFYRKRTGYISAATLLAGAVNVVTNYLFIPRYGYGAAAWTTLGSFVLLFGLHYVIARFLLGERVARVGRLVGWYALAGAASYGYVQLDAAVGDYLTVLLAVKVPAVALLAVWVLRVRKTISRVAASDAGPDGT